VQSDASSASSGSSGLSGSTDDAKSKQRDPSSQDDAGPAKGRKPSSSSGLANKEKEPSRPEPKASKPSEMHQPKPQSKKEGSKTAEEPASKPAPGNRTERRVKMNSMRKRIAERLKQSQNAAASLTTFNEIDMSSLMQMRSQYKDQILKQHGIKFGFMSAFAKASALALQEIPAANASIEGPGPGEQIVYRDYVDLSVAVATPKGLVTPIVRNVESMSMLEIEKAIADLGKKARDNKLTLEDMTGGTFTM
jgi:2-oxoglutarate dehydrogenase E2 component (dihydrolipoamide succinyltransferase)